MSIEVGQMWLDTQNMIWGRPTRVRVTAVVVTESGNRHIGFFCADQLYGSGCTEQEFVDRFAREVS